MNYKFLKEAEFEYKDPLPYFYFPLCNEKGLKSCITPFLRGDVKLDQKRFITPPQTRWDIQTSLVSRKIFLYLDGKILSLSKLPPLPKDETLKVGAGFLYHKIVREFKSQNIIVEVLNFVPLEDNLEIMVVNIKNVSQKTLKLDVLIGVPLYGRSADNIRDHHHVSSLLNRIYKFKNYAVLKPTLIFDERGHKLNKTAYFAFCVFEKKQNPKITLTADEFIGEGNLEAPQILLEKNISEVNYKEGKEAFIGFKKSLKLLCKENKSLIIGFGAQNDKNKISQIIKKYDTLEKIKKHFEKTKIFWRKKINRISFFTGDQIFDNWIKWVLLQPILRRIYGNSFLPDFDYGRGGRGWRDLWQDLLTLLFVEPKKTKSQIINNFKGVRIDGTNATIITYDGNFIADRNNIPRVWSDHGVWPFFTTNLYINFTGDIEILFKEVTYWRDHLLLRAKETDSYQNIPKNNLLKTSKGKIYKGTILEHILVQNLVSFFNVGPHNNIKLENADWNDALDCAPDLGESVAFTHFYAYNLKELANLLKKVKENFVEIFEELFLLLDTLNHPLDYQNPYKKRKLLEEYLNSTKREISGKKVKIKTEDLIRDLERKSNFLYSHLRNKEWLDFGEFGFFNGYYDNKSQRVEGVFGDKVKMTLTGQVFAIMSRVADPEMVKKIIKAVKMFLYDKELKGFRLNTDFKEINLNLGRAFGFSFGDKENGAFFSHMNTMFSYALYEQNFIKEGWGVLKSLFKMAISNKNKSYPLLPEYFNSEGQGLYWYLTGSASWYIFTLLTQVFGVKGEFGDLVLEPKFTKENFKSSEFLSCEFNFCGKRIKVIYNLKKEDKSRYKIDSIKIGNHTYKEIQKTAFRVKIPKTLLEKFPSYKINICINLI